MSSQEMREMNIHAAVEPLLKRPLHRDFTDHSVEHLDRIIEKLNDLTKELMKSSEQCLSD